jgi:hypothetical protein
VAVAATGADVAVGAGAAGPQALKTIAAMANSAKPVWIALLLMVTSVGIRDQIR